MDEVFGSENFVSLITFKKTAAQTSEFLSGSADYIVWYCRNRTIVKYRSLYASRLLGDDGSDAYMSVLLSDGTTRRLTPEEASNAVILPTGAQPFRLQTIQSPRDGRPSGPGSAMHFPIEIEGVAYYPSGTQGWKTTRQGIERLKSLGRLAVQGTPVILTCTTSDPFFV